MNHLLSVLYDIYLIPFLALFITGVWILVRCMIKRPESFDVTGIKERRKLVWIGIALIIIQIVCDAIFFFGHQYTFYLQAQSLYKQVTNSSIQMYVPSNQTILPLGSKQGYFGSLNVLHATGVNSSATYLMFDTIQAVGYAETNVGTGELTQCPDDYTEVLTSSPCKLDETLTNGARIYAVSQPLGRLDAGDDYMIQMGSTLVSPSFGYFHEHESGVEQYDVTYAANSLVPLPIKTLDPSQESIYKRIIGY